MRIVSGFVEADPFGLVLLVESPDLPEVDECAESPVHMVWVETTQIRSGIPVVGDHPNLVSDGSSEALTRRSHT